MDHLLSRVYGRHMRNLLMALLLLALAPSLAQASGGHIANPTMNAAWTEGTAGFSVTNSVCGSPCSWRAVADALPALYSCPDEPFTAPGNIAWQSSDLFTAGTVATPPINFTGPVSPTLICLYLDRRASGADHYLLAAYAIFTPNSLPDPAETFDAIIADPISTVRHHWRHWRVRLRAGAGPHT